MWSHRSVTINITHCQKIPKNYSKPNFNINVLHRGFISKSNQSYPSISSAKKYDIHDAQLANSAAKSYDQETPSSSNNKRRNRSNFKANKTQQNIDSHDFKLRNYIQSHQFNNAISMLHLMMQQHRKLKDKSIFPSILYALKLCKKHQFHILELIEYMKLNNIKLDQDSFREILVICVAKNDEHSAKQIALLWFEAMPEYPVLDVIKGISSLNTSNKPQFKYHKLGPQEKIWQSVIDELSSLTMVTPKFTETELIDAVEELSHSIANIQHNVSSAITPTEFISNHLSQIQVNLTAKNIDLGIKHLHELHDYIINNPNGQLSKDRLLEILHHQNANLSEKRFKTTWSQWMIRQEIMNSDINKIETNDTLKIMHELGFNENTAIAMNNLFENLQSSVLWTNSQNQDAEDLMITRLQKNDHTHELERKLPNIVKFIAHNTQNGVITKQTMNDTNWINNMVHLIVDTSLKSNTMSVSRILIDNLFDFMHKNYVELNNNLLFHKVLFDYLKTKLISQHRRLVQREDQQSNKFRKRRYSEHGKLRKLFQFINGYNKQQINAMKKIPELKRDIFPLLHDRYPIESFYFKAQFFPNHLSSNDLTNAIVEAAYRFEYEQMGQLLYYLFYHRTPSIIDSDSFSFDPMEPDAIPLMPLEIEWDHLQKIYSTMLALSSKAYNHLQDIDFMHLLNYTPLPLRDISASKEETEEMKIIRKRQQRVLQLLAGINARSGSFEKVMETLFYFNHDSIITNNMRSYGSYYLNETLLHAFTVKFFSVFCYTL